MTIDEKLIRQTDALTTGANAHELAFVVGAYKALNCAEAERFLRIFVATHDIHKARESLRRARQYQELDRE